MGVVVRMNDNSYTNFSEHGPGSSARPGMRINGAHIPNRQLRGKLQIFQKNWCLHIQHATTDFTI